MNDTILNDRQLFLSKLWRNPAFLSKQAFHLIKTTAQWFRIRAALKLAGPHLAGKKRPSWLPNNSHLTISKIFDLEKLLLRIPEREINPVCFNRLPQEAEVVPLTANTSDLEDFFTIHRWGWLLNDFPNQNVIRQDTKTILSDWVTHNKNKDNPDWEPYSSCERVANLLTWVTLVPKRERMNVVPEEIGAFLIDSVEWIFSRLEYYGPLRTNNHILNNARALVMAGSVLDCKQAIEAGFAIFHHMLPCLVQPGGFLSERSSHYQLIIFNWILDALYFARHLASAYETEIRLLEEIASRMAAAAAILCNPYGYLSACIGDISPDATPKQNVRCLTMLYPKYWPNRQINFDSIGSIDDWYWLKDGENTVLVNFPQGKFPHSFPTHGHADITSFVWIHKDRQLLCDTGRYRYTKDKISNYQKSAMGHNVPTVDGLAPTCEDFTIGKWAPSPYERAFLEASLVRPNTLCLSHNGFWRGGKVEHHLRDIKLLNNTVCVRDRFEGNGSVEICLRWQCGSGLMPVDSKQLTVAGDGLQMQIDIENGTHPSKIEWLCGHQEGGSFSPIYGQVQSNSVLLLYWHAQLPFEIKTIFSVHPCVV